MTNFDGMWAAPGDDPRTYGQPVGELATIREYLTNYRLTLGLKCDGLTPEQLATRSVPPSIMSLLGLIRHMARVEHGWFYRTLQGNPDVPRLYSSPDGDEEFHGATADPAVIEEAFTSWRAQIAAADRWLDDVTDLGAMAKVAGGDGEASVRDILIHMVEEYARHCGHADLLRECIDGRTGQ
ncbi:DinB family protein [Actinoplanes sp. M2I2]|uniref:DinB family protein n=1 Tax=Actinoplanes sp. M2I2 TaxID=1734444 RepID=UPI00202214AE|nr:DinB family protein [Actinoplanes sp. M2I2]